MIYKLKDLFELQMGKTPSRHNADYWGGNNKWISIADIGNANKYIENTKECISDKAVAESGIKKVPKGTVIMSFKLSIGKTTITTEDMFTNEAIMAFIDKGICPIDTDYLYHFCCGKDWLAGTNKAVMGLTLNKATLSEIKISVPNIEIQREIALKLDKIDELIGMRRKELDMLIQLVKSRFIEMFGTLSSNEQNFEVLTIEALCSLIKDGTHQTPTYTEDTINGFKFLSSKDVMTEKIDWSDIKYIPSDLHDKLYAAVKPIRNDILMSKNGVNYGVAAVNDTDEVFDIYVSLALLRPKTDIINPVYFRCAINNPDTKRQFDGSIKGIGVPNLHLGEIKKTQILVPPMDKQIEYVSFVEQTDKSKYHGEFTYEMEVAA